jgi:hypothetical protein
MYGNIAFALRRKDSCIVPKCACYEVGGMPWWVKMEGKTTLMNAINTGKLDGYRNI